jgi:predicted small metal-binding protein
VANEYTIEKVTGYGSRCDGDECGGWESSYHLSERDAAEHYVAHVHQAHSEDEPTLETAPIHKLKLHKAVCKECGWQSNPTPDREDANRHGEQHVRENHGTPNLPDEIPFAVTVNGIPILLTEDQKAALVAGRYSEFQRAISGE